MADELLNGTDEELARIDALRDVLRKHIEPDKNIDINIYCFHDQVWGAVRISEISFHTPGKGGGSYMHSDLDAAGPLHACEWYLVCCFMDVIDHGGTLEDPEQEARRGVIFQMTTGSSPQQARANAYNNLPEWEERDHNPLAVKA